MLIDYQIFASSFIEVILLLLIFFKGFIIKASATISEISATLVSVTAEKVFLQRGQAVARISGVFLVNSLTASKAIFFLFCELIFIFARLPPQQSEFSSSKLHFSSRET